MVKIVNLTRNDVVLRGPDGTDTTVPKSGIEAKTERTPGTLENRDGFPVPVATPTEYGAVVGLPEPEAGTVFIVSAIVGERVRRADVFCLGTGPDDNAIRNDKGHVIAVTRLIATA